MKTIWTQHLKTQEEKNKFKENVLSSSNVLDRLREILYNRVYNEESVPPVDYDSGSWAYKQADRNGYLRAYREIIEMLILTKD